MLQDKFRAYIRERGLCTHENRILLAVSGGVDSMVMLSLFVRGGYEVGVEALWRYCEYFNVDMVVMYTHMGCKAMSGYHGIFEEEARKHGIHLIWVTHNLMKPEDASRKDMRMEVNRYMRTVLREEPLDPSLEDFDDAKCW